MDRLVFVVRIGLVRVQEEHGPPMIQEIVLSIPLEIVQTQNRFCPVHAVSRFRPPAEIDGAGVSVVHDELVAFTAHRARLRAR